MATVKRPRWLWKARDKALEEAANAVALELAKYPAEDDDYRMGVRAAFRDARAVTSSLRDTKPPEAKG